MAIGPRTAAALLAPLFACLTACGEPRECALAIEVDDALRARIAAMSPLPPLPPDPTNRYADDPAAARFGQTLFFDGRLSGNGRVSCATCHDPDRGFTDGRTLAVGLAEGNRHTPTLWNVGHQRWLTWDGRADSLWMQALDPIEDVREMGGSRGAVARLIHDDPVLLAAYVDVFGAFPDAAVAGPAPHARPVRAGEAATGADAPAAVQAWNALSGEDRAAIDRVYVHVGKAIAAYQRLLVRGDAPFDTFVAGLLEGDEERIAALSPAAQRGLRLFLGRANCVLCHSGPAFSDGEFHNNSLPTLHGGEARDAGRYDGARVVADSAFNAAGPHSDAPDGEAASRVRRLRRTSESWGEFRTPSLRNLANRAPFMHQGQLADLGAVLSFYSDLAGATGRNHHQEQILVPLRLSETESAELEAFLASLEGAPASSELLVPTR
ncbi:MAG: cytochrome c peroxidase [Planctomycetota bacterium]